jgi:hypothetical protein
MTVVAPAVTANDDDLVAALECRANPDDATTITALATNDPEYGQKRGWTLDAESPLYRPVYTLAKPIMVFGHQAEKITIMSGNSILVFLPGVPPASLGEKLEIKPDLYDGETFMGARVLKRVHFLDPSDGTVTHYKIAYQVTNFSLEPADTMAGCSYIITDPPKGEK